MKQYTRVFRFSDGSVHVQTQTTPIEVDGVQSVELEDGTVLEPEVFEQAIETDSDDFTPASDLLAHVEDRPGAPPRIGGVEFSPAERAISVPRNERAPQRPLTVRRAE